MKTQLVRFVDASRLFENDTIASEFSEACSVSFGDAGYTLVSADKMLSILEYDSDDAVALQKTIDRITSLPHNVYINLEA